MKDLHVLPKFRDGWSYLYTDRCRVEKTGGAVVIHRGEDSIPVPCATLATLLLGPGSTVTHGAMVALASSGCSVIWCGEEGMRVYGQGMGETRKAYRLLHQAKLNADPESRMSVVRRMYETRFSEPVPEDKALAQLRGMEGIRVRRTYESLSRETGVPWSGRSYRRDRWSAADPVNRAISAASSCLYGICHAAIVSVGYSTALGFIHTGRMLSFVYDIADLYKTEITIPLAFAVAAEGPHSVERRARAACRDAFRERKLLARVVRDMDSLLEVGSRSAAVPQDSDDEPAHPGTLWDPNDDAVPAGTNYGPPEGGDQDGSPDT